MLLCLNRFIFADVGTAQAHQTAPRVHAKGAGFPAPLPCSAQEQPQWQCGSAGQKVQSQL